MNEIEKTTLKGFTRPDPETGCWVWRRGLRADGHGQINWHGKFYLAHRLAWEVFIGEVPEGRIVHHRCGRQDCINPEHLYLGGPLRRGPPIKLTDEDVLAIYEAKETGIELAHRYRIANSTVSRIRAGKHRAECTWRRG